MASCLKTDFRMRHLLLWVILSVVWTTACSPESSELIPASHHSSYPLVPSSHRIIVEPDPIAFGALKPGQHAAIKVTVRNPLSESATIQRVETSCPCIHLAPLPICIPPGQDAELTVCYDPDDEPNFRGDLSVNIKGFDRSGNCILLVNSTINVK